uniref:U6 snRNA phosphodiesterase n=1 Tax=Phallusia mammillata TaxID=59560 RepID=A0A6F9DVQ3_9ASCI|nr:U6 snRNA phosphodiesterase-like [Phallusia mammillata]
MSSLSALCDAYGSESESDDSSQYESEPKIAEKPKLPMPKEISSLFETKQQDPNQDHQGRIRSFAHERGNWATYVYIPYPKDLFKELKFHVESIFNTTFGSSWQVIDDFHVTVSKTVVIPHHCIDPLVESLQEKLKELQPFSITFTADDLKVFVNDEKTRSFCGFKVQVPLTRQILAQVVQSVDETFVEFHCEKYYINPSFHMSIAWCLGEVKDRNRLVKQLAESWTSVEIENPELFTFNVTNIVCKSGNKQFYLQLKAPS